MSRAGTRVAPRLFAAAGRRAAVVERSTRRYGDRRSTIGVAVVVRSAAAGVARFFRFLRRTRSVGGTASTAAAAAPLVLSGAGRVAVDVAARTIALRRTRLAECRTNDIRQPDGLATAPLWKLDRAQRDEARTLAGVAAAVDGDRRRPRETRQRVGHVLQGRPGLFDELGQLGCGHRHRARWRQRRGGVVGVDVLRRQRCVRQFEVGE